MPISLAVDHGQRLTRATAVGMITLADLRTHLGEEGDRTGLGYRELIDASKAVAGLSSEDVKQVVGLLEDLGRRKALGPTAVIVADEMTYGMVRMLGLYLGDTCEVRPFRVSERGQAEAWLAVAPIKEAGPG